MADKYADWTEEPVAAEASDPYAGWTEEAAAPAEKTSAGKAALLGAASGVTADFFDELGGAIGKALLPKSSVKLGSAAQPSSDDTPEVRAAKLEALKGEADRPTNYQLVRDIVRKQQEEAKRDHGGLYTGAQIGGGVLSSIGGGAALNAAAKGLGLGAGALNVAKDATLATRLGHAGAMGAGQGALSGVGASTEQGVGGMAKDALIGGAFGAAGGAFGEGLASGVGAGVGALNRAASSGVTKTGKALDELAQLKVGTDLKSAGGDLGTVTQQGNRLVENLLRLEASGGLSEAQAASLQQLRDSGVWDDLVSKLANSALDELPGKAAEISGRQNILSQMQSGKDELFTQARKAAADPMAQIKPRLQRYGAPVAGALAGPLIGGAVGLVTGEDAPSVIGGALMGAGARPSLKAIGKMMKHPAVQQPVFSVIKRLTQFNPAALGKYAQPLARAAAGGERSLVAAHYVLAQKDPEYRDMTDQFAEAEPQR